MKNQFIKRIKTLGIITLTFICLQTFAQNGSKIKDNSVSGSPVVASPGAILELESKNKGFLVPRMTTAERDAIPSANRTDGLLIFNTTTGCFNHWIAAQSLWYSICGTPPPASFSITSAQCSAITLSGTYNQGVTLNGTNLITVPVTVSQPGNYVISATSSNGYSFDKSGNFPTTGTFNVVLNGSGAPLVATANPGDALTLTLNGTVSSGCNPRVPIVAAPVNYTIDCSSAVTLGTYNIGVALTAANKITLNVNVSAVGTWSLSTPTINGISFSGTGVFASTGVNTITLQGTGTPLTAGSNNYIINSNSASGASCAGVAVNVAPAAYTINCGTATLNGTYMEQVVLTGTNTITLPINVTSTGPTNISTNTVNDISFSSGNINLNTLGAQNVTLFGTGIPARSGTTAFVITGGTATCNYTLNVVPQPVAFTITCGAIAASGTYSLGTPLNSTNSINVPVNVTNKGSYTITTNTVNGISFSASGVFNGTGNQVVTLLGSGTPASGGNFTYTISSNGGGGTCTATVNVPFRIVNVLTLGDGEYSASAPSFAANAILTSTANFSTSGTVKVQSVNVINGGSSPSAATLKQAINTNNIDVIVITFNSSIGDAATVNVLTDFVNNKKGVIIHAVENNNNVTQLINAIFGASGSTANNVSGTPGANFTNPILSVNHPIVNGPFGDLRSKLFGLDVINGFYYTNIPANATSLVSQSGAPAGSFVFVHNTLGYLYIGDGGWLGGTAGDTNTTARPAKFDNSGRPLPKDYVGGQVYNANMFANALAWAFGYAQQNTVTTYIIP